MKFEPWKPQRPPKPFVFITDANGATLEICDRNGGTKRYGVRGGVRALENLGHGTVIYSLVKPKQLILFAGAQNWKVIQYHERTQRLIFRDTTPVLAFSTFGPDPQALLPFFDALAELGIGPASLSTMASNSWKRLLHRRFTITEWGKGPKLSRLAFHGGRKEALQPLPAIYSGAKYLDLPAAYLQAMRAPIPVFISNRGEREWCDEGICEAIVRVPEQSWNPLPYRLGRGKRGIDLQVFPHGTARGFFVVSELRNAIENHGVDAELVRVWKGYPFREPFRDWLPWAFDLRKLEGASGLAAKHMTTRLWSLFARNPLAYRRIEKTFEDRQGLRKIVKEIPPPTNTRALDGTVFLSAIIASRVRVRLLEELIPAGAVYVDTDGGIVPSTAQVPGWPMKQMMDTVEVHSSQAYRWQCPNCLNDCRGRHRDSPWHYSVSGMQANSPFTPAIFERMPPNELLRLKSRTTISIPTQTVEEAKAWLERASVEVTLDESL